MLEHLHIEKIKRFWKWGASGSAVIGASIWAGLQWVGGVATTGVIVKTAATTGLIAAATAFTFTFGDKAGGINEYANKAYALILKGEKKEAVDYTDKLITAIDQHLNKMEKEVRKETQPSTSQAISGTQGSQSESRSEDNLKHIRVARQGAELLRGNIKVLAGVISDKEWIASYEKILNADSGNSEAIMNILTHSMSAKEIPASKIEMLLKQNLPADARGVLALWLMQYMSPDSKAPVAKCTEFYEGLLAYSADSKESVNILSAYIKMLEQRQETSAINEALGNYILLFYDSDIGLAAAKLAIARETNEALRNGRVIEYVEKYHDSKLGKGLRNEYAIALISKGKFVQGLEIIDTQGTLKKAKTPQETAEVLVDLANEVKAPQITPFSICLGLSQTLFKNGDYVNSMEMIFATLKSVNVLPINLLTQRPIRKISEVVDQSSADNIELGAKYFLACALERQPDGEQYKQKLLEEMRNKKNPTSIDPYILSLLVHNAVADGKWDLARKDVAKALNLLPTSPVLINLQSEIELKYQQARVKERITSQQQELLKEIAQAQTDEQAIKKYEKLAELYLADNDLEQAVGVYLQVVEKYPKHGMAPASLLSAISVLEQTDKDKYASRIAILIDRLRKTYPDSAEAKRYSNETASVKK